MYKKVREACLRDGKSQRSTAKSFGLNRRTVSKMIQNPEPLGYKLTQHKPSKLDSHKEFIDKILAEDKDAPAKQRHTAKRIFDRLVTEQGFGGGYTIVREYLVKLRHKCKEMFIPLEHPAGDAQVDFGEAHAVIGGVKRKVNVFVMNLPQSDACFVKAYLRENTESFCDGHVSAFEFFGGVPTRIIYDNSTIAVSKILLSKDRKLTEGFIRLQSYYFFKEEFARPSCGNEKGKVEGSVGHMRRNFLVPIPQMESIEALNDHLLKCCHDRKKSVVARKEMSIEQKLACDKKAWLALPEARYEACRLTACTVNSESLVRFDNNDYSVPTEYGYKKVLVKGYVNDVVIALDDKVIARHKRSYEKGEQVFDHMHYLRLLERKPNALEQAAPLKNWKLPECFGKLRSIFIERDRQNKNNKCKKEYIRILRLSETFSINDVTQGIKDAEKLGVFTRDEIRHLILRRIDDKAVKLEKIDLQRCKHVPNVVVKKTAASDYNQLAQKALTLQEPTLSELAPAPNRLASQKATSERDIEAEAV